MKIYYNPEDIRKADETAVEKLGLSSLFLMENAGRNAAEEILQTFPKAVRFVIFAGPGNNGGDGFVAARRLLEANRHVVVITSCEHDKYKNDALRNLERLKTSPFDCTIVCSQHMSDDDIKSAIESSDCSVDALLGTGSFGPPRGDIARLISLCGKTGCSVAALDIPSGIDPKNGAVYEPCVKADLTVTFLAPKIGMGMYPACGMCGRIAVASIGADIRDVIDESRGISCFEGPDIKALVPPLPRDAHKGERGGVLICGGSRCYRGAPVLAAMGALRSGAGLAVMAIPDFMTDAASAILPEAIFLPIETVNGEMSFESLTSSILPWVKRCGAAVFGPGSGREETLKPILRWLWDNWKSPLLLDGDALRLFAEIQDELPRRENVVITPHNGEAAAILGTTADAIKKDRQAAVMALAQKAGIALLKGMNTLVAQKNETRMILEGSPALSVPGSGDVLSGAISAFLAYGLSPFDAATSGALIHAAAGLAIEESVGTRGTFAREIADALPYAFR